MSVEETLTLLGHAIFAALLQKVFKFRSYLKVTKAPFIWLGLFGNGPATATAF